MNSELKTIMELAEEAGDKVLEIYGRDYEVNKKKDKSPVTEADLASEKIIIEGLKEFGYPILSEETKDNKERLEQDKVWIVDPLDGTRDFLDKTGEFSIMIGLVENGEPILGTVHQPLEDKIYYAEKGFGSFLVKKDDYSKRLKVSEVSQLSDSHFIHSRSHFNSKTKKFLEKSKVQKDTSMGSTGLKLGLIAEGEADFYITTNTFQWDSCAPEIILREAGGKVTDLKGNKLNYNREEVKNTNGVIASNGKIHQKIVDSWG